MSYSKLSILFLYIVLAIIFALLLANLFTYKMKYKAIKKGVVNTSYTVWLSSILLSISVSIYSATGLFNGVLDFTLREGWNSQLLLPLTTTCALYLGFPLVLFMIWFYIVHVLAMVVFGKRKDLYEIESDNYGYFIVKGTILFSGAWSLNHILALILVHFNPVIAMPFYN